MAGKSLQSSELTAEEILQVALREIGSDNVTMAVKC